jgi:transcription elongation factor Elf1
MKKTRTCPICGRTYNDYPALSRKDNKTYICPECGTREALEILGISREEQDKIIKNSKESLK